MVRGKVDVLLDMFGKEFVLAMANSCAEVFTKLRYVSGVLKNYPMKFVQNFWRYIK